MLLILLSCAGRVDTSRRAPLPDPPAPEPTVPAQQALPAVEAGALSWDLQGPLPPLTQAWSTRVQGRVHHLVAWQDSVVVSARQELAAFSPSGAPLWSEVGSWTADLGLQGSQLTALGSLELRRCAPPLCDPPTVEDTLQQLAGVPVELPSGTLSLSEAGTLIEWGLDLGSAPAAPLSAGGAFVFVSLQKGELVAATPEGVQWRENLGGPGLGRPLVHQGRVCATSAPHEIASGQLSCFDLDGTLIWREELHPHAVGALGYWEGQLIAVQPEGVVQAWDLQDGTPLWTLELSSQPVTGISAARGRAYVGLADATIRVIDLDEGGELGKVELPSMATTQPLLLPGQLIVGCEDGSVLAFKAQ